MPVVGKPQVVISWHVRPYPNPTVSWSLVVLQSPYRSGDEPSLPRVRNITGSRIPAIRPRISTAPNSRTLRDGWLQRSSIVEGRRGSGTFVSSAMACRAARRGALAIHPRGAEARPAEWFRTGTCSSSRSTERLVGCRRRRLLGVDSLVARHCQLSSRTTSAKVDQRFRNTSPLPPSRGHIP